MAHTRGDFAGKQFILEPWQSDYFRKLLGTFREDGLRQYTRSLLALPRKNGKTQMCAALAAFMGFCDDEGAEVIMAAGSRSQAGLMFDACKQLLESCPALAKRAKIYRSSIVIPERNAVIKAISSEAGTKHGFNCSACLIDEYHVFKDRELIDVLETSVGSRAQPIVIYVTTAGTNKNSPCYKDWDRASKIEDGSLKDSTFLPCIFAADPDDDIFSEKTWEKANPNYNVTLKPSYFEQMSQRAKESPADEIVFRTLHLNQWCASETRWLRHAEWEANMVEQRPTADRPCWLGVDLSSTEDTTAVAWVWGGEEDGTFDVGCHLFIPEDTAIKKSKSDRVPYLQWAKEGFVTMTEGDITDYDAVRDWILTFCDKNAVKGVAIDRWNAVHLTSQLVSEAVNVRPFGQGYASMSSPTKFLRTLISSRALRAGTSNHALAHQMGNVEVKTDEAGNIKPTKKHSHSTSRIDGAVALIMAMGLASEDAGSGDFEPEIVVI